MSFFITAKQITTKYTGLKAHMCIMSEFLWVKARVAQLGCLLGISRGHWAVISCGSSTGEESAAKVTQCRQDPCPGGCRTQGRSFLLAVVFCYRRPPSPQQAPASSPCGLLQYVCLPSQATRSIWRASSSEAEFYRLLRVRWTSTTLLYSVSWRSVLGPACPHSKGED